MSFLSGFLQRLFHSCKLLDLASISWLLDSLDRDDESIVSLDVHLLLNLDLLMSFWLRVSLGLSGRSVVVGMLSLLGLSSLLLAILKGQGGSLVSVLLSLEESRVGDSEGLLSGDGSEEQQNSCAILHWLI